MTRKRVIIVGGGLAGMSAAEALARHGGDRFQISLLESKRVTGGRAGSFDDPASGDSVDYCQHVTMGCCTSLIGLLERCGLAGLFQRFSELQFLHPEHPPSCFAASRWLPAPFHLARSISGLRYMTRQQQVQIRKGLWRLLRSSTDSLQRHSAGDWLRANGQDTEAIRAFWDVIVVSALGDRTDVVAMSAVRKVLVDGFAIARGASDVLVPTLPLAELFGRKLRSAIERLGVDVLTAQPVRSVIPLDHGGAAAETDDDTRYEADHVIVAVPWYAISGVLSKVALPSLDQYGQFASSSITGIHLWLDREITDRPHAVMVGTLAQWLFRNPFSDQSTGSGCYYQIVISASHEIRSMTREDLLRTVFDELGQLFPLARDAKLLRSRIVTDPKSVFSIRPEVEAIRPDACTPFPWLHLAGDWIATGWPATMEGAVISGRMAVQSILRREGHALIEVDTPQSPGWLARRLIPH